MILKTVNMFKKKYNIALMPLGLTILLAIVAIGFTNCINSNNISKSQKQPWHIQMLEAEMVRNPHAWMLDFEKKPKWNYTHGLLLMAAEKVWKQTNNNSYSNYISEYYNEMIDSEGKILHNYNLSNYNIDHIKPGINLFDLYEQTNDQRYLIALNTLREQLKSHPRTIDGGFWHKKIYPHQLWLDGVYMNAPFYARYGLTFNEPEIFDDIVHQIILVEQKTRDASTGLLYHAYDDMRAQAWSNPETGHSPNFWGRAMGWYAMALVDVLDYIPAEHPGRTDIQQILQRLMDALSVYQDPNTGLWYQVVDQMDRDGNYLEASVSCMVAYTMAKGVNNNLLDSSYMNKAEKAFQGILNHLISFDEDGYINLNQVCAVAGLGGNPYRDGSYDYYINETIRSNDPKGVGPFILLSMEMEKAGIKLFKVYN
jgi:unsaturated rhamnogalacturonyl hydrolase